MTLLDTFGIDFIYLFIYILNNCHSREFLRFQTTIGIQKLYILHILIYTQVWVYIDLCKLLICTLHVLFAFYESFFLFWQDENITENSGYQLSDLTHVILCLYNAYSDVGGSSFQAAYEKYKKSK